MTFFMTGALMVFPGVLHAEEDDGVYRLIVKTDSDQLPCPGDAVIASFDDLYLLQFDNEQAAARAADSLSEDEGCSSADISIRIASEQIMTDEEDLRSENIMSEDNNPFVIFDDIEEDEADQSFDVALIDTGASCGNNVIEAVSVLGGEPKDDNGHGTRMAEHIISQNGNVRILSIKALDSQGKGDVSAIIAAIKYAMLKKVKVINLSVCAFSRSENAVLAEVIRDAISSGTIVVGAAGNYGMDASGFIPGNIEEALIVGAADPYGHVQPISNFGDTVDLYMPSASTSEAAALMSGWLSLHSSEVSISELPAEALTPSEIMEAVGRKIREISDPGDAGFEICSPVYEPDLYWYPVREDNYIRFTAGVAGDHFYRLMWRADWWDDEGGPSDTSYEWKSLAYCIQPDNQEFPRWIDLTHPTTDASENMTWATLSAVLLLAPYADGGTFYNADGLDGISLFGQGASYITIAEKGSYFSGHASDAVLRDILFAHLIVGRLYNGSWSSHAGTEMQAAGNRLINSIQSKLRDTSSLMYRTVCASTLTFGNPNTQIGSITPDLQQKVAWVQAGELQEETGGFEVVNETTGNDGILKVSKKVEGGRETDMSAAFEFTLTANKSGLKYKKYDQNGNQVTAGAGSGAGTAIASGGTFTLTAGQYVLISMPAGCRYTVSEVGGGDGLYTVETEGDVSGQIPAPASGQTFSYTVTINDTQGNPAANLEVNYSGRIDGSSATSGVKKTNRSGRFTFTLASGGRVEFSEIPEGYSYTVTVPAVSGYTVNTPGNASGQVDADDTPEVRFIHVYDPVQKTAGFTNKVIQTDITIRKTSSCTVQSAGLSSELYSSDLLDAVFRIRVYDRHSGELIYDALYHPGSSTVARDGTITATLDINDADTLVRVYAGSLAPLLAGDWVTVRETKAPEGYLLPSAAGLLNGQTVSDTQIIRSLSSDPKKNVVTFSDVPGFAPARIAVDKFRTVYDLGTPGVGSAGSRTPVYDNNLRAGAVFLFAYYDNYNCSGAPSGYWYFMNDASGHLAYGEEWLLTGFDNDIFREGDVLTCQIPAGFNWGQNSTLYRDADGSCNLPLGSFSVREVWAPPGYQMICGEDGSPAVFKGRIRIENDPDLDAAIPVLTWLTDTAPLSSYGQYAAVADSTLTVGDREIQIAIGKSDSQSGSQIAGAVFEISDVSDASRKYTFTTTGQGYTVVRGFLETGHTYILKEAAAPDGYVLNEDEVCFYVRNDGTVSFEDCTDALGTHIVPQVRHLLEEEGALGTPDEVFYTVMQEGMQGADYEITCSEKVLDDGGLESERGVRCCVLNIKDAPNRLQIFKQDADGLAMAGVRFTVRAESLEEGDTETVIAYTDPEYTQPFRNGDALTTDEDGKAVLYRLKSNDVLIITEVKTQEGMSLLADPVYIRVSASGRISGTLDRTLHGKVYRFYGNESRTDGNISYDLYVDNMSAVTLMTGGEGSVRYYMAGISFIAAAFCLLVIRKRKEHEKGNTEQHRSS